MSKVKENWERVSKCKVDVNKSEVRDVCLVDSEKVLIFLESGVVLTWIYQD